jgi:hypothetical protein
VEVDAAEAGVVAGLVATAMASMRQASKIQWSSTYSPLSNLT